MPLMFKLRCMYSFRNVNKKRTYFHTNNVYVLYKWFEGE